VNETSGQGLGRCTYGAPVFLPASRGGEECIRLGDSQFTILVLVEKTMGFSFIGDELAVLAVFFIEFDEIFWLQRETDLQCQRNGSLAAAWFSHTVPIHLSPLYLGDQGYRLYWVLPIRHSLAPSASLKSRPLRSPGSPLLGH